VSESTIRADWTALPVVGELLSVPATSNASTTGVIMVAGQNIALGRVHAGKTVTVAASDTHLAIHCDDGVRTVRRTTDQPVRNIKANRPCQPTHAADETDLAEAAPTKPPRAAAADRAR
jgi:hypothetical protein